MSRNREPPLVITEPVTYCLTGTIENKVGSQESITILTDNVRILGNGNCIIGPTEAATTIDGVRAIDRFNILLVDLCIVGHKTGVIIGDTIDSYNKFFDDYGVDQFRLSRFISVHDLRLTQQTFQGIHLRGEGLQILRSSVEHVGGTDTIEHAFATGLYVSGTSCEVVDNRVFGLRPSGNGEGVGIAVYSGAACRIANNLVDPFKPTKYGRSCGIWSRPRSGAVPIFKDNVVVNADYAFGPFGFFI